jgi:hypothetical protein
MPRDGSGNFTLPANTQAVSGDPISSTKFNTLVQDLEADANTDRPIVAGGTGASTALAARENLGLEIGVNVQAFDAGLLSIAGLTTLADRSIYTTASDTYAVYTLTAAGRAILDDADAAAQRTTLGLGTIATQAANNVSITGGSVTGITDLTIADGGTGASDAGTARTNLGLAIGTNVQAYDAGLQSIAGLTTVADRSIYTTASDTYAVYTLTAAGRAILDDADAAAQRTTLGLGTAALKNTGTSGDAVPLLDAANTFSAAQIVNTTGTATSFSLQRSDDGATGVIFDLNHISASPAASDALASLRALGRDSGNNTTVYGRLRWIVSDPTDTSEDSYWTISSLVAGLETSALDSLNGTLRFNSNTVWHAGNDGAASGLDADLIDGVQPSAFALTILDDADAAAVRTTLGLGTAAIVNTGTSGATIPLLNGANTFSGNITITNTQPTLDLVESDTTTGALRAVVASGISYLQSGTTTTPSGDLYFTGKAGADIGVFRVRHSGDNRDIWHAGNDGAGSGLDADTLDGVQGSSYATLTGSQTLTNKTLTTPIISAISNTGTLTLPTSTDTLVGRATTDTLTNKTISGGTSNARVIASTETTGTLTVASANETIQATGDITIPNAVFSAGDIILIYAGASARTITEGASVTMRLGGTATTGSRTLAARGVAVLFFVSSSEVVVSGGAVT